MKLITDWQELEGKTIKAVATPPWSAEHGFEYVGLEFTDGSLAVIGRNFGYDNDVFIELLDEIQYALEKECIK